MKKFLDCGDERHSSNTFDTFDTFHLSQILLILSNTRLTYSTTSVFSTLLAAGPYSSDV